MCRRASGPRWGALPRTALTSIPQPLPRPAIGMTAGIMRSAPPSRVRCGWPSSPEMARIMAIFERDAPWQLPKVTADPAAAWRRRRATGSPGVAHPAPPRAMRMCPALARAHRRLPVPGQPIRPCPSGAATDLHRRAERSAAKNRGVARRMGSGTRRPHPKAALLIGQRVAGDLRRSRDRRTRDERCSHASGRAGPVPRR